MLDSFRSSSCRRLLSEEAPRWPRPTGFTTNSLLWSASCKCALIHVWKNGGTASQRYLMGNRSSSSSASTARGMATRSCSDWQAIFDSSSYAVNSTSAGTTARTRKLIAGVLSSNRSPYHVSALIRDPTARYVSSFLEVASAMQRAEAKGWSNWWASGGWWRGGKRPSGKAALLDAFERFAEHELSFTPYASQQEADRQKVFARNFHAAPQAVFLSNFRGEALRVDYLGRAEQLRLELAWMVNRSTSRSGHHHHPFMPASITATAATAIVPAATAALSRATTTAAAATAESESLPIVHHTAFAAQRPLSAEDVAERPRLQRMICKLVRIDYCCFGFPWPPACAGMENCAGPTDERALQQHE
jgi:hypothetical protein